MLTPDSRLTSRAEMEARLQQIYRARAAECDKPAHDRRGIGRPELQARQRAKLLRFDARADALKARIRAAS